MARLVVWGVTLWMAVCLVGAPGALAQQPEGGPGLAGGEATAWLIDAPTISGADRAALEEGLEEALRGESSRQIVGEQALRAHIEAVNPPAPECLRGERACGPPAALAYDALGLALVVRLKVRKAGGQYEAAYSLIDRRQSSAVARIARGKSPRALAFALVRAIYDATGVVDIESEPIGARVLINGSDVGTTPVSQRLPIGEHLYTLRLPDHAVVEGRVEVRRDPPAKVSVTLEPLPGVLVVEGAPPGAAVFVDGVEEPFDPASPIELPPGSYAYEVRAEGYKKARVEATLEAGATTRQPVEMERLNPLLRDIARDEIIYNKYWIQLAYEHTFKVTGLRGARDNEGEDVELEFRRFSEGTTSAGPGPQRFFDPNGVRLSAGYSWENFGLTLLSLSILNDEQTYDAVIEDLNAGELADARLIRINQVQVRPAQLTYRFFYNNIVPEIEAGVGFNFQSIELTDLRTGAPRVLTQTEPFWGLGGSVKYFFTPRWFASVRYGFQAPLNADVGVQHMITIGAGGAFPNIFGFEPVPPAKLSGDGSGEAPAPSTEDDTGIGDPAAPMDEEDPSAPDTPDAAEVPR
jgi:hypothetical protein